MSDTAGSLGNTAALSNTAGSGNTAAVDVLLREAGMDDDGGLRTALLELRSLSAGQPVPSAAVAALMVPAEVAAASAAVPVDELAARRRAKRRITMTTLSVAASLAAGGAVAVASDQGIRDTLGALNHAVTSFVSGTGGASSDQAGNTPSTGPTQPGGAPSVQVPGAPALSGEDTTPATPPASGGVNSGAGVPAPATPGKMPPSGFTLPDNLAPGTLTPGLPGADTPVAGTPGDGGPLGSPLNGLPLDEVSPSVPRQQPLLPFPATPPASPAPGQ